MDVADSGLCFLWILKHTRCGDVVMHAEVTFDKRVVTPDVMALIN